VKDTIAELERNNTALQSTLDLSENLVYFSLGMVIDTVIIEIGITYKRGFSTT